MVVRGADLARNVTWVPAVENRGEGIFLLFRRKAIENWLAEPSVIERAVNFGGDSMRGKPSTAHRAGKSQGRLTSCCIHLPT
jgi:hypothetical protein